MKTLLYVVKEPGDEPHLLNEINPHSRFVTMKWWAKADTLDPEVQLRGAHEQMMGWKHNGPYPRAVYSIEQYDHNGFLINEKTGL